MIVAELATCHVPEDPMSPTQWGDTLWYEMTMWMYLGLSCLDHPFSAELDGMEVNTRI
jgi:hypothetical protein